MSWFRAIENAFSTGRIQDRLDDLRAAYGALTQAHEALKKDHAALQAENLALKQQVAEIGNHQREAPLPYPKLR